ncbi:MAG: glucose-6-phosphate dehydrogenase, partial [Candidatus Eisenbacteria bacterium]|nr:glucose-6-phosphate dehydrogenase [Candidatus Eisenbacteria bacterium]
LYSLAAGGRIGERFALMGVARSAVDVATLRRELREGVDQFSRRRPADAANWERFAAGIDYVHGDFGDPATYATLARQLHALEAARGLPGNRLFYLATPSSAFGPILTNLKAAELITPPHHPIWTRVIIEKPFGRDLDSSRALNALVATVLDESQTFRIDHYLGKETVQNIMVFRFANALFEPTWNRRYVDYVEITAAEDIGIEGRGAFYDQTGVLRDMVQCHLLEVLCLTAMEPPTTGSAEDVRGEKLKVLHALRVMKDTDIPADVVLGQYKGYRSEPYVAPTSTTPTYAAIRAFVDNWRWHGVPFYMRTGKRLAKRVTEVSVHLHPVPLCLFEHTRACEGIVPNVLTLRIQPDEGIQLAFSSKMPGDELVVSSVTMDMKYVETFGGEPPEAYERLLLDAMRGDPTLFLRRDWVEASWAWLTPVLRHFERQPPADLPNYEPDTWGPMRCELWIRETGRVWRDL